MLRINGDIHGRKFWKLDNNTEKYDKIVFLGDYLDPYGFENITVEDAIENFKEIIEFKKNNTDKVVLLVGNHDAPYFSDAYFNLSSYHCRHSKMHHKEIHDLFNENKELFQFAYAYGDILFTHAGVDGDWLKYKIECESTDVNDICSALNSLSDTREDMAKLYMVTRSRGGYDRYGSCLWADVGDIMWDKYSDVSNIKQIFGHTLQAFYGEGGKTIVYGDPKEFRNCKMVDTASSYDLDTDNFTITPTTPHE